MQLSIGNAKTSSAFFISFVFAFFVFAGSASAQDFAAQSEAQFVLLGPRIESGLIWDVERRRDEAFCSMTTDEVRRKLRKSSSAVVAAAFEILREARIRCAARKLGIDVGFRTGFNTSVGVGGEFGLNSTTETQTIGSNGVFDPIDAARKAGINYGGVVGSVGIGYDWKVGSLFSPTRLGAGGSFIGVNVDVTFGGGSKTINGIPGIVPFVPAATASMDMLRYRRNVGVDFTARVGTYISPTTSIYALGGVATSSISLKYDCPSTGFCGFGGATPAFSTESTKWAVGGVFGAGIETKADWLPRLLPIENAAMSLYIEYRAHIMDKVAIDVGSVATRSTSQEVDLSYQTITAGARIRF